jgi:hypothetical protein
VGRPRVITAANEPQLEALLDAGCTQVVAARALEISPRSVSRWVADERARNPGDQTLEQLLAAIEPLDELLRAMDEPPRRRRSAIRSQRRRNAKTDWRDAARRLAELDPVRWGPPPGDDYLGDDAA